MKEERLSQEEVENIFNMMAGIMMLDLEERQEAFNEADENEQEAMLKTEQKIKRFIATRRITINDANDKIEYHLSCPIKQLKAEIHTLSFGVESMKVGKLLKSQSNKNLSDADKGKQFVSTALNLPLATTDEMIMSDFTRVSEVVTFFTIA